MHYTTIDASRPRGVKILEDIIEDSTSVLAMVLTLPISVRATAVNLANIPRCVACILFWVHLFETFDCAYFQRSCNVTNLERVNPLQEQVASTLLDPHNMPDLNCIPPDQRNQGWALLRSMVITVIDEVKNSDASNDVNDSIEEVNDFLVTASAAATVNFLDLSSAEIADREIKTWKTHSVPFPKDKNPLDEWRCGAVHLFPWLGVLARRVLTIPATSAAPERLFSTAGNVMTKKRSHLTCENMEELVNLHEVCPQVREWEAVKKMRLE